jgi:hypothetical protein
MFNFFKKKIKAAPRENFKEIAQNIYNNISKSHTYTKDIIIQKVNKISPEDKFGSQTFFAIPLYEAIYGYQITCLIGFSSQEGLISIMDILELKEMVLKEISNNSGYNISSIEEYNQSFLECAGNIECLNNKFSDLIFEICSIDKNSNDSRKIDTFFKKISTIVAIETQKNTALAFGEKNLFNDLDKVLQKMFQK